MSETHDTSVPTRRGNWPRLTVEQLWLGLPVLMVVWCAILSPPRPLDFWWHLKTGELIVTEGTLCRIDQFSFTATGQVSVPQYWLAQAIYYLVYRAGGLPALIAMNTAMLVTALWGVLGLCRQATTQPRCAAIVGLLPAFSLAMFGLIRPQGFSFVFLAWYYRVLTEHTEANVSRSRLWLLPVLMVLWVNMHGAFVLGLALLALFLVSALVGAFGADESSVRASRRRVIPLAVVLLLSGAATLLNPDGSGIYAFVRSIQQSDAVRLNVSEWQPPRINELGGLVLFHGPLFMSLFVLMVAGRRLSLHEIFLFLAATGFGLLANRNAIWFSLLTAPLLVRSVDFWWNQRVLAATACRERPTQSGGQHTALNWLIAAGVVIVTLSLVPWRGLSRSPQIAERTLLPRDTPIDAMNFIQQQRLQGHIFHPQIFGDYLLWRLWPEQRSFLDGRVHLFSTELIRDYQWTLQVEDWEARLAKYQIRYLLLSVQQSDNERLLRAARESPRWRVLYEDEVAVLFVQTDD